MKKRNRRRWKLRRLLPVLLTAAAIIAAVAVICLIVGRLSASHDSQHTETASEAAGPDTTGEAAAEAPAGNAGQAAGSGGTSDRASEFAAAGSTADTAGTVGTVGTTDTAGTVGSVGTDGTAAEPSENQSYDHTATELETGRQYLKSLEERTPMEIEVLIESARAIYEKKREEQAYLVKREEYRQMLGGDLLWSSFQNAVLLGDSRVVGYTAFQFLPEEQVLADIGDTIDAITDHLDTLRGMSPEYVFISYGINDIGVGLWPTADQYAEALSERLDELQEAVPDAQIYVNSILPAKEEAVAMAPAWGGIPEYSEAVRKMCAQKGISFINNGPLVEEHGDLYAEDGVHLQPDFYRYWAENQLLAVYDRKHDRLTFPEPGVTLENPDTAGTD